MADLAPVNLTPVNELNGQVTDSGGFTNNLNAFVSNFNSFVVTPLTKFGIGGFVFDVEGDTSINLRAEITDHYVEDNSAIQDHIAIRPKKLTLRGYVGELVFRPDGDTPGAIIQSVAQKLITVGAYLPELTKGAEQAYEFISNAKASDLNPANLSMSNLGKIGDYYGLVKNLVGAFQSRQQAAYQYFKAMMEQRVLTAVQTPFEYLTNMAIEEVTAIQGENSKYISDFAIVLKQIRLAETQTTAYTPQGRQAQGATPDTQQYQGRAAQQAQPVLTGGNMPGLPSPSLPGHTIGLTGDVLPPPTLQELDAVPPPLNQSPETIIHAAEEAAARAQ